MVLNDLNNVENSFRRLAENLPGIVYRVLIEDDNRMIFFNDMVQTMTGYSPEDLKKGKVCSIDPLILPEDRINVINIVKDAIENNVPFEVEYRINNKSGELKWFFERGRPIRGDNGNPSYIDGVIFDITERKDKEEMARLHSKIMTNMSEGLYLIRLEDLIIAYANPRFEGMFGYDPGEIIGKNVAIVNAPTDKTPEETKNEIMGLLKDTGEWHGEVLNIKKDGTPFWCYANVSLFDHPEYGRVYISVHTDITANKKMMEELRIKDIVFNASLSAQSTSDINEIIDHVNPAFLKMWGYKSKEEAIGISISSLFANPDDAAPILEALNETGEWEGEFLAKRCDGSTFISQGFASAIYNENGDHIGFQSANLDITKHKEAELKLKIEKEKAQKYLDIAGVIIVALNADQTVQLINQKGCEILKEEQSKIIGMSWFDNYIPKNVREQVKIDFNRILSGEIELLDYYENAIINKDGEIRVIAWHNTTLKNEDGEIIGSLSSGNDITESNNAELKLKESEEKYRKQNVFLNNILESLTHPFYVINVKDYTVALANSTASSEGLELGQYCYSLTHNNNKPCEAPCKCPLDEVKKTKRACIVEHKHYDKEGNEKIYKIYGYPILDESGNVVQMIEYALNISDRKKAEQKLIESEEKFRTIAERTYMGILIIQDNQVKYVNEALLNMFEYSQKEIADWEMDDLTKLTHSEDLLFFKEYREHLRSGDKSFKPYNSYRVFTKSGKIKWIDQFSKEILYRGRSAELVTIIDITEKKEVEHELIKLNNLKSELLRRTSHELRTPLVSIKGFSDLLLELHRDKLDDYVMRTIEQIRMGCNRLESLVNDILKTAELESGTVELKKSKEDLSLLIKICVSELEGLSELRNHTINLEISDKLICSFEKKQMYNVITNILSNAIKFTPYNGKIEVKSEINNDFIIVSIKDNGIGFTEEEKTQIFKQFGKIERYGQGYDVISEGSGLGLFISKKIVELHGGEIWLESEGRDKGSTFYFSLPII